MAPITEMNRVLRDVIESLGMDPHLVERVYLSVVSFRMSKPC